MLGAVFPTAILYAVIGLCVLLLIKVTMSGNSVSFAALNVIPSVRQVAVVVVIGLWTTLMSTLGFALSSGLAFIGIMAVASFDRPSPKELVTNLVAAVVIVGGFYLIMSEVLNLRMPQGILF